MPHIKVEITKAQKDFLDRKKQEIAQQERLGGRERRVTTNTVIQGMLDLWMTLEKKELEIDAQVD